MSDLDEGAELVPTPGFGNNHFTGSKVKPLNDRSPDTTRTGNLYHISPITVHIKAKNSRKSTLA